MADNKQARLTDAQKKANHIDSERKRREAIREGFDRLSEIVPGMYGQGRSEAVVLQNTVQYLMEEQMKREKLKSVAMSQGMSDREFEDIYRKAGDAFRAEEQSRAGSDSNSNSGTITGPGAAASENAANTYGGGANGNGNGPTAYGMDDAVAYGRDDSSAPNVYGGGANRSNYPPPSPSTNPYDFNPRSYGGNGYGGSA